MKKYLLLFSTVFLLAACNSGNSDSQDSTAESTVETKTSSKASLSSSTKHTSSSTDSSTVTNTKTQNSSTKTNSSHENHALSAMEELQANYPNEKFPDPTTISGGKSIGITVSEAQQTLTINYYEVGEDVPLNDPSLNGQSPIARFQRKNFDSNEAAQNEVGQTYDPNGQQVDLGYNITGYQSAGAGSSFLMWQEGNWSLAVQANNLEQENPIPLAKQTVEYLEQAFLPVPHDAGQISLRVATGDYQSNIVVWQDNQTMYTIMNADSMNSLKMAVSMAN
ncbi:lipoprotein [Enterococcus xiangfangensis]|uniref:Lipoprotein n=1 Tax=Enterococcus xiangfangensis TaxID=1296537 RepID=A0ABU3F6B9_9ENTE|nr:lipoprotein [Enterococcus xiangfangensis]MDT2758213.1 lipoprotein [Enterococcus xiangfangensis]